jgi:arylsulfatase A-like enzyme
MNRTLFILAALVLGSVTASAPAAEPRPNVLWIYLEDVSGWFSCAGEKLIETPHIDRLAAQGTRFTRFYTTAGVCSATRSAVMLGAMQTTYGVHHHRSSRNNAAGTKHDGIGMIHLPEGVVPLPQWCRQHGVYTFNDGRGKDDFNFVFRHEDFYDHCPAASGWGPAHTVAGECWQGRKPGQPFFGQVQLAGGKYGLGRNATPPRRVVDRAAVPVPPYYPDIPEVREEIGRHYDCLVKTDEQVGEILAALERDGLADSTVVILFSDHGYGLHRHKQFLYEGGIHMPLIVAGPGIPQGHARDDLTSSIDVAPTTLGILGLPIPSHMEGRDLFAADYQPREFVVAARDRCDYTIERIRAIVTKKYKYLRNYLTDRPYMQPSYKDPWPVSIRLREMMARGEMNDVQKIFFGDTKPAEELYDLETDPHEIVNLAGDPAHASELEHHRQLLAGWIAATGDKGQEPEDDAGLIQVLYEWGEKCVNPEYDRLRGQIEPRPAPAAKKPKAAAAKRPNILFILTDDQPYKTVGCYPEAPDWVRTPHIDRLAAGGVRFERAYLGSWCMPSRASLLTGKLQHGIESMRMAGPYPGSTYDPAACPFIPAEFRRQGYHTAQIGKWHTGTDSGFGRDWDRQIVWNRPRLPDNAGDYYEGQILCTDGVEHRMEGYSTDIYTDLACDYIRGDHRAPDKPWYLWLCYGAVHGPTKPASRHAGALAGREVPVPADIFGPRPGKPAYLDTTQAWDRGPDGQPVMRRQGKSPTNFDIDAPGCSHADWVRQVNECALAIDEGVGKLLAALEETGQLADTLVVFSSDQGFALGEHGLKSKLAPYDAAIASPLIVSRPGAVPAGVVRSRPVNSADVAATLCRQAGVTIPWETHGRDFSSLLTDAPEGAAPPMLLTNTGRAYGSDTATLPEGDAMFAQAGVPWWVLLRDGRHKYVRTLVPGEIEEVYDLMADPEELDNLASRSEHRQLLERLRSAALEELRRTEAPFLAALPRARLE